MLFLPPNVLLLSTKTTQLQLTTKTIQVSWFWLVRKKKLPISFFGILLPGVHCLISTAFILCSCIDLHHHICCFLEPGSSSTLYFPLSVTFPPHYLLFPSHHTINRLHQWRFYIFFYVIDKDIKPKNTGGTLLQTQLADDLQLHLETCQGARF